MKKFLVIALTSFCCAAQVAMADTNITCDQQFGANISSCASSIDPSLSGQDLAAAQKACHQAASAAKQSCISGQTQCLNTCTSTYNVAYTACLNDYDPSICGGNTSCEQFELDQQAICITDAKTAYSTCTANCQ